MRLGNKLNSAQMNTSNSVIKIMVNLTENPNSLMKLKQADRNSLKIQSNDKGYLYFILPKVNFLPAL